MKKKILSIICSLLLVSTLSGCNIGYKKISYTVYPIGYILERLTDEKFIIESVQTDTLVQRSNILGNYKEIIGESDLFLHIGNIEPYMSVYSKQIKNLGVETIDLSIKSSIYKFQRYTRVSVNDVEQYIESSYYNNEAFDNIDVNSNDLSLWLDPISMVSMAREIKNWLQKSYPEDAKFYEGNFSALESDLIRLDAEYQSLSTKLKKEDMSIKFVSMTPSFGNWQRTYGIQVYPICLSKYGALPTDKQLEVIKQRIIDDGVKYIAFEPNMSDDMVELLEQLEAELDLVRVNLSNLSSINATQKEADMDYISIMYENLFNLQNMAVSNDESQGTQTDDVENQIVEGDEEVKEAEDNTKPEVDQ